MSKGWSRKNQQRPPKTLRATGADGRGVPAPEDLPAARSWARSRDISDDGKNMTFEWGDMRFWFKFTHAAENPLLGHISAQAVPYEDSVLPIELRFPRL